MNADDIANIQRKLERLSSRTQAMDADLLKYSRDLEWAYAVQVADYRYKKTYIDTLSRCYREGCEWWVEIGNSLKEYLRKNPRIEAWIRGLYFRKYESPPSKPTGYIDV